MRLTSITQRFMIWFLLISLLPIVLIGSGLLYTFEQELQQAMQRQIAGVADKKVDQIDAYLSDRIEHGLVEIQGNTIGRALEELVRAFERDGVESAAYRRLDANYRDYFQRFISSTGYYDLLLISPQGAVVYTQKHEADFASNLFSGPYRNSGLARVARNALSTLESGISEFELYAPSGNAAAAFIALPVMSKGKPIGVLALQIDDARLFQVLLDKTGMGESGETVLARLEEEGDARVLAPLKADPDATLRRKISLRELHRAAPLVHALNGERGGGFAIDYSGVPVVAAWRYLPMLRAGMVVKMDAAEALAPYYRVRNLGLAILALALSTALLGAWLLGRRVVVPLKKLGRSAQDIAAGRLDQRVTFDSRDELGMLADSFNTMAQRLQASYANMEEQVALRTAELTQVLSDLRIKDAAIASSINAIAIAGMDGKLSYVNQAFVDLWRLPSAQDALGRSPVEFWANPDDAAAVMQTLQQQGHWQGEMRARLHDGGWAELQLSATLVKDGSGQPVCMMGSFVNVSARKLAELELQQSEALLASLVDNMPAMVFVKRASDLRFEKLNRAGETLLGLSEQELLGKNDYDFFPREQAAFFTANDRAVLATRQLHDIPQEPVLTRNGESRILHTRKIGIYNADGEATHLLGVSIDITEQKKAEAALQRERDYAASLVNTAPMIVLQLDTEGFIEYVNPYFEGLTGYRLEEVQGKEWFSTFLPARDQQRIRTLFQQSLHEVPTRGNINPIVTRCGAEIEIEWNDQVMCDAQGKVTSVLAVGLDVTARSAMERALSSSEKLLKEAQRIAQLGSWELELSSGELTWSDEIFEIFEIDQSRFGATYEAFLDGIHPDDRDKVNQAYIHSLETHSPYEIVHRLLMNDGRVKWVRERCHTTFDASGKPLRSFGTVQDVTEQKVAEEKLRVAAVTFEMHEAIMITDAHARIIRVNQAFQDITGYSAEDVLGKNPRILSSGRQDMAFYAEFWQRLLLTGSWSGEIWDKRKNGQIYPKWMTVSAVKNAEGETSEYVSIFSDITARKQAEEEIRNLAFYDSLTHLPNRRLLLDRFHQALAASARSNNYGAVMFLDMDRFKTLNDTLGHDYGDLLLIEVSRRIQSCVRETDTVARLGGDEFVIVLEGMEGDAAEVSQRTALIAEKIRIVLAEPYLLKGHECHSSPSIGVCLYRGNVESVDDLLKHADMAMYQAKDAGRNNVRFFDPLMQQAVENRAALEVDLRSAVARQELRLFYQVQVDKEYRPLGAEALIRWLHPQRGMVSPAQFIPIAEESLLILEIGHWVLDSACRQLALWGQKLETRHLVIAINVSAQQFMKHDFVETVAAVLRQHRVDPSSLKVELTESMVLEDVADVVNKMHALKALGVKLSMDDFGTGYSSLSYLKQLPLDQIKIDQSFVRDVISDPNDAVLVQTIIDMAKNFRLHVIAEGVETDAQLSFLQQHGCMAYQGYLFSKPVPIEEFEKLLAAC